jgi:lysophospholipase L1-like esterase
MGVPSHSSTSRAWWRALAPQKLHNGSVLGRTALLVATGALVSVAAGCGYDDPPIAVATGASSIPHMVRHEIRETSAVEATDGGDVELTADVGTSVPTSAPTTVPHGSLVFEGGVDDGGIAAGPPPMPATVAVIGDSIALSAEPYVTGALEGLGVDVIAYEAVENRRMVNGSGAVSSGRNAIHDIVAWGADPELWLVALGTNDVGARTGREAWRTAIDELMAEIPADADVVWIDTWVRPLDEHAVDFNDALRDELRTRDDVWVLDWHGRAADEDLELVLADGVHLTETGKIEFARLVGDGLRVIYD